MSDWKWRFVAVACVVAAWLWFIAIAWAAGMGGR